MAIVESECGRLVALPAAPVLELLLRRQLVHSRAAVADGRHRVHPHEPRALLAVHAECAGEQPLRHHSVFSDGRAHGRGGAAAGADAVGSERE